jgi:hypothetical protein
MSYTVTNGYAPRDYETILQECVSIVNQQFGESYTVDTFKGTNLWKYLYATMQGLMTVENNIAELGVKLQDYIRTQNEELVIPRSSPDGITQIISDELGLTASVKPTEESDAGHIYLAVDVDNTADNYEETKKKIFSLLHQNMGAGLFYEGTETGTVVATNGQSFDYAFELPTVTPLKVKIDVTVSDNTTRMVETTSAIKEKFLKNFAELYRLGFDFEPSIYLCRDDLPFASLIKISYATNGSYSTDILKATFDEKITVDADDIEVNIE